MNTEPMQDGIELSENALCWSVGASDGDDPALVVSGPGLTVRLPLDKHLARDLIAELSAHAGEDAASYRRGWFDARSAMQDSVLAAIVGVPVGPSEAAGGGR
ncbi:MAG: hypothetical protein M3Q74_13235 [Pseudomonadota bacterium]|nr:hypothetical protein [Pseudomonadota bacterium]